MIRCHDELHGALQSLEAKLEAQEPFASEKATEHVIALLSRTTEPSADPRLRPIFMRCQKLADDLKAKLQDELRRSGITTRAAQAYERASP